MARMPNMRRDSAEVAANDALRVLNDRAFKQAISDIRSDLVEKIVTHAHDGTEADDAFDLERCQELRTLERIVRKLRAGTDWQALREHNKGE